MEEIEVYRSWWGTIQAVTAESSRMQLVILPDHGAKIVSLYDKAYQHEWLVGPMRPYRQTVYGADFVSQDMSGWDEMLPTINACQFEGAALPDHGEVWSIPWDVYLTENTVVASVSGTALPYLFTRSAAFLAENTLQLSYRLKNTGETAFPYLWAAHPQFAASAQTRIMLPPEVNQVVNVMDADPVWGASGERYPWPHAADPAGKRWRLDRVRSPRNRACRKFYLPPEQPVSWAGLAHQAKGCMLRLGWSPEQLPYLGIWVDEGRYNARPVVALEPSNAFYDSLARAVENHTAALLEPNQEQNWEILIQMDGV